MIQVRQIGYGATRSKAPMRVDTTKRAKREPAEQISGVRAKVTDASGSPISGASVQLRPPGIVSPLTAKTATTDAGGNFVIWARGGIYELVASAPGYQETVIGDVRVPQQGFAQLALIALQDAAPLEQVTDDNGVPTDLEPANGAPPAPPAPVKKPWYKRWWVWAIAGGAVVVVIGGIALATRKKKKEGA
jgi:hypothetical protein